MSIYAYDEAKMMDGIRLFQPNRLVSIRRGLHRMSGTAFGQKVRQELVKSNHRRRFGSISEAILSRVAGKYGLTLQELKSPSQSKRIVRPRGVAMVLLRRHTKFSLVMIGRLFGGKDHGTVHYNIHRTLGMPEHMAVVELIGAELGGAS